MSFYLRLRNLPIRIARRISTFNRCSFWTAAAGSIAEQPLPPGFSIQWLDLQQLQELVEHPENPLDQMHLQILRNTTAECVAVFYDKELAGLTWTITGDVPGEFNHDGDPRSMLPIHLPVGTAFLFGVFVMAPYRGQRLYPAMVAEISSVSRPRGIQTLLITTECSNLRALKSVRRMGFNEIGRTTLIRVGRLVWSNYPSELLSGPIRVGRYAGDTYANGNPVSKETDEPSARI
jgi:ribosomal protein S18 acetylase RimI-like enzyme